MSELKTILPELKTVLRNVHLRFATARQADSVIEGYVDPSSLPPASDFGETSRYEATSPLESRSIAKVSSATTLPEPYPVFHVTAITHRKDAVYPATIVGIPPMEDFYIGGAALTRPAATLSHPMERGWG